MIVASVVFALWAIGAQARGASTPVDDLATAKSLYASGTYEEALTRLAAVRTGGMADEADEYRALCLLALGRQAEAQSSIESLIGRNPFFRMSESEVSPRLVTMFHDLRKKMLPAAVRDLYASARTNFEKKNYNVASGQLRSLLALISDDDLKDQAVTLADLKMLGEGFLKLSDAELAAAAAVPPEKPAASASAPASTAASTPPPAPTAAPGPKIYSPSDADVTPPVDVSRQVPPWRPPNGMVQRIEYRGLLRIVIDEKGKVEAASLVQPVSEAYDAQLIAAAKQWTFKPAMKGTQPVKYLKMISVVLAPR